MRTLKTHALLPFSLLLCLLLSCAEESPENVSTDIIPTRTDRPRPSVEDVRPFVDLGGRFSLVDQRGEEVILGASQQRVSLLFFGYTYCPDFCPTTLSRLVHVKERLGADADSVDIAFVSVDPQRDTPDVLASYLAYFPIRVHGLTGSRAAIDQITASYQAEYALGEPNERGDYTVDHSTSIYLLDTFGRVRHVFNHDATPDEIVDVLHLLWQSPISQLERSVEDDPLLAARDLGTYGCALLGADTADDYRLWSRRAARETSSQHEPSLQPTYEYGLDR